MSEVKRKVNHYEADVLVIGGGPAGAWAAWSAANSGAKVVLVDKGYLGSSGATAPGGTNLLYLPPDQELRDQAVAMRMKSSGLLAEPRWIYRVLDQVYTNLELVEQWGYPFIKDEQGEPQRNHLHGPEYMAIMRKQVKKAGVKVLDQAPALELLVDEYGVGGARGVFRQRDEEWEVHAHAVVIATGGCAFLSKGLGCNVLTGDGYLMAGEAGAELSGMEFSRRYAPSPAFGSNTRSRLLGWATYYDESGNELAGDRGGDFLAKRLLQGPVYATMNKADTPHKQAMLRSAHTIFFLPYDRAGIDVFEDKFPLTLRYEGTVRGTGGLRIVSDDCATTVAGLYAAGDAATRERVAGAASGGGAFNASWAICSGTWSGEGAAAYAKSISTQRLQRQLKRAGKYGIKERNEQQSGELAADVEEGKQGDDREDALRAAQQHAQQGEGAAVSSAALQYAQQGGREAAAAYEQAREILQAAAVGEENRRADLLAAEYESSEEGVAGDIKEGELQTNDTFSYAQSSIAVKELVKLIQDQVLPLEINYFRSEAGLEKALARLNELWPAVQQQQIRSIHDVVHAREAAAMAATARWMYTAALQRKEKRGGGLHVLAEYPELDPAQQHRIILSGIEDIRVSFDTSFQNDESYHLYNQQKNEHKEVKTP